LPSFFAAFAVTSYGSSYPEEQLGSSSGFFFEVGMNELSLSEPKEKQWYTIEELASLCGYASGNALLANPNTNELLNQFNNSKDIRLGGYHNTQKFYSENVLKALKEYQHNNSSPNAVIKKTDYIESHAEQYTLEQLSCLTGLGRDRLNQLLPELCNQLQSSFKFGGYHNTQKFYSENVLKALKQYQIKNSVPNALKDKEAALTGNVSFIQNQTVKQTIDNLLDNPDTLQILLNESLARSRNLGIENKQLREVIEEQKPKVEVYDHFLEREQFCNFRDASNYLGISQTDFMNLLKTKYIYKNSVGEYRAYSDYAKYFTLRPYDRGNDKVGQQLMLNISGLEFFKQKLA